MAQGFLNQRLRQKEVVLPLPHLKTRSKKTTHYMVKKESFTLSKLNLMSDPNY